MYTQRGGGATESTATIIVHRLSPRLTTGREPFSRGYLELVELVREGIEPGTEVDVSNDRFFFHATGTEGKGET